MNRQSIFHASSALALALGGLASTSATAQTASTWPDPAQDPAAASQLDEIVITAQRRSENLQTVPVTVSAFRAETLQALSIKSTIDLPQAVPGLSITRTLAGANSFLRGVGSTNSGTTSETQVAVYIDGLYLPNSASAVFGFNNIERIEVLKGPQGTLYGRNTTGGLISVITRDPGRVRSFDVSATYANYDTVGLNFYGSTPLTDTLSVNLAATYTDQADGWGRNVVTGSENFTLTDKGLQAKLLWEPSGKTRVTLRGFYDHVVTDQGVLAAVYPGSVGADGTPYQGERRTADARDGYVDQEQKTISLKIEQNLGFAELTSITGYINSITEIYSTQNGIPGAPVTGRSAVYQNILGNDKTFSQELQLSSLRGDGPLKWIVGAFYYHDDLDFYGAVFGTCVGAVCAGAPVPQRGYSYPTIRSSSVYGEGTYDFNDATRLTLGLRYTSDHKAISGYNEPLPGRPNSVAVLPATIVLRPGDAYAGNPTGIDPDVNFSKVTYKAVLSHDFAERIHGYLSYNRGFKSGGFNPTVYNNPASQPEVLDAYEVGVKSEMFDRRLRLNVAGFYYDYQDIQLRTTAPPAPPGATILFNAAGAEIKGVDVDFNALVTSRLLINGGFELLDAHYVDFPGGTCVNPRPIGGAILGGTVSTPCDLSGKRVVSAPKVSFNLGVTYTVDTSVGAFALAANDGYKSRFYWDPDNRLSQEPYHLLTASLTWTSKDERYSAQAFVKNLGDSYYYSSGSEGAAGTDVYVPGTPRTFGLTLRYRY